jgi:hypothetical protein
MALTADDRAAIREVIALHGHLVDGGELDRLGEVFTDDVVYDVTDLGGAPLVGLAAQRDAALALGEGNPVGHHVTNTVVTEEPDGRVRALCWGAERYLSPECHGGGHDGCRNGEAPLNRPDLGVVHAPCACPCHAEARAALRRAEAEAEDVTW